MKRHVDALPSKDHWSGGSKIRETLKVIIKGKIYPGLSVSPGLKSPFAFLQHLQLPPGLEEKASGGCFHALQQPRPVA